MGVNVGGDEKLEEGAGEEAGESEGRGVVGIDDDRGEASVDDNEGTGDEVVEGVAEGPREMLRMASTRSLLFFPRRRPWMALFVYITIPFTICSFLAAGADSSSRLFDNLD